MNSVTRGSGIALSVLVAATASVLLLVPGHPRAGSWRGTGGPGGVMVATAAATSPAGTPGPGGRPQAVSTPAAGRPAAGSRPVCRAAGAPGGRALAARGRARVTGRRPGGAGPARTVPFPPGPPAPGDSGALTAIPRNPP